MKNAMTKNVRKARKTTGRTRIRVMPDAQVDVSWGVTA